MRAGVIIPVACYHSMQERSWRTIRQYTQPETPVYVLFQAIVPMPVPDGVIALYRSQRFDDEADLWQWGLTLAQAEGWDWCMFLHDDFAMCEPGWEAQLAVAEGWRVATASWLTYEIWDDSATTSDSSIGHLGVAVDSMSFGFRTDIFAQRGCVAATRFGFGFGAWDANAWALANGYGCWKIQLSSDHNWEQRNSRAVLGIGAPGHPEIRALWRERVLPAKVISPTSIQVQDRVYELAPQGVQVVAPSSRITANMLNGGRTVFTDGVQRWTEVKW